MGYKEERRQGRREMCSDFVQIDWVDQEDRRKSCMGLLEDVSPKGLCISVDLPVPIGCRVYLRTEGFKGEAQVAYCNLGDYGYLVGLEFLDGCCWDREKWRPKHLLGKTT